MKTSKTVAFVLAAETLFAASQNAKAQLLSEEEIWREANIIDRQYRACQAQMNAVLERNKVWAPRGYVVPFPPCSQVMPWWEKRAEFLDVQMKRIQGRRQGYDDPRPFLRDRRLRIGTG